MAGAVLVVIVLVVSLLSVAAPAQAAAGDPGRVLAGSAQRSCPDTRCSSLRTVPTTTTVPVSCWRDAGVVGNSARWFRVRAGGVTGWVHSSRMDRQPKVPYCSDLLPGETLFAGQSVWSSNSTHRLVMQADGNLVSYSGSKALWSTRTGGTNARRAVMQGDGNLVVYGTASSGAAQARWNSGTQENPGTRLVVQSDANLVLYTGATPLYASSWYRTVGQTQARNTAYDSLQCTHLAYERFRADSGVYPNLSGGDAHAWDDLAAARGWKVQKTPATHAIVVFEATSSNRYGHVAYVERVQLRSDGMYIFIQEKNYDWKGSVRSRWVKHHSGLDYIPVRQL